MRLYHTLLALGGLTATLSAAPAPAFADPGGRDADRAYVATQRGHSMPLPSIERRVMPLMGGADYLGPEFNGDTYRLKFMREGRVIWIDVDAATGRILGNSNRPPRR